MVKKIKNTSKINKSPFQIKSKLVFKCACFSYAYSTSISSGERHFQSNRGL